MDSKYTYQWFERVAHGYCTNIHKRSLIITTYDCDNEYVANIKFDIDFNQHSLGSSKSSLLMPGIIDFYC